MQNGTGCIKAVLVLIRPHGGQERERPYSGSDRTRKAGPKKLWVYGWEQSNILRCPPKTHWNFWWVLFSKNYIVYASVRKNWVWIYLNSCFYAEAYFQFRMVSIPLNLSYNMLWTWRTYHETLPYSIYWNVVSGGIWWRRRGSLEEEKPRNTQLRWIMRN